MIKNISFIILLNLITLKIFAQEIIINLCGDILIANNHENLLATIKDSNYFYEKIKNIFYPTDLSIANLEFSIIKENYPPMPKKYNYYLSNEYYHLLKWLNIDCFMCANNHTMDYGILGAYDIMDVLDSLEIDYCGIGANIQDARTAKIYTLNNTKIGILNYSKMLGDYMIAKTFSPGINFGYISYIKNDIKNIKSKVDILIIYFHWGGELTHKPKPYQYSLAHLCIDNGADIVVGSHSHTFIGVETYKNKPIIYSLGNFIFGTFSKTNETSLTKLIIKNKTIQKLIIYPLKINNRKQFLKPFFVTNNPLLKRIKNFSKKHDSKVSISENEATIYFY